MNKAIKWIGIALGSFAVIFGIVVAYVAATFNPNDYKADIIKAVSEKIGKVDSKAFAAAIKDMPLYVKDAPGLLVDTKFDKNDPDIFKNKFFVEKVDEIWNLVKEEAIKAQGRRSSPDA